MNPGAGNVRTADFKKQLAALPERIQDAACEAFEAFKNDPFEPTLENHGLSDSKKGRHRKGSRAVSVTRRYRAIYVEDDNQRFVPSLPKRVNVWYWIGSHEDYNNFIGSK